MSEKSSGTTVKRDMGNDALVIQANYILVSFGVIFQTDTPPILSVSDEYVTIDIPHMALILIRYEDGRPFCELSLDDNTSVILTAELVCILKDMFHNNITINSDTFVKDNIDGSYIWGRELIDTHNENVWGKKVESVVYWADEFAGHS